MSSCHGFRGATWIVLGLGLVAIAAMSCSRQSDPANQAAATADVRAAPAAAGATLCEHGVPADLCTQCTPDLIPVFKSQGDWCVEHGVPESLCLKCNPDLAFSANVVAKDWCKEHAVPESKCTKCKPALIVQLIEAGDYCRQHEYPASVCPFCHPELVKAAGEEMPVFPEPGTKIVLASPETALEAGIETRRVERRPFARTLEVVGQLTFDQNRHAQLSARGEALVLEVKVDVGDEVRANQALVLLASSAVGTEQARLSAARARLETASSAFERERGLAASGVSPQQSAEQARSELAAAQADYDAANSALGAAGATPDGTGGRYMLRAPFKGTVVGRDAVTGKTATAGQVLVEVADLSTMWAVLDIPEAVAGEVRPGLPVRITFEGTRGEVRTGKVVRVGASVDPQSRTVRARVELPNPDRNLKAGAFLRAAIEVAPEHEAILVPQDAVQRVEDCALVFVEKGKGLYEPVAVELGPAGDDGVEIVKGLSPGMDIVTTGAFLLKTEILKESIGAGCCEVDAGK
jgi:cobalt-zinc-cadmium efflux system membrane fusion protein